MCISALRRIHDGRACERTVTSVHKNRRGKRKQKKASVKNNEHKE
jgi:hypothetical protein